MSTITFPSLARSQSPTALLEPQEVPTLPLDRMTAAARPQHRQAAALALRPPTATGATLRPTTLDQLRAREREDRGPLVDNVLAHMNIVAGALDGALGIHAGAMFGYEAEYANARTAARIESAIVGVISGAAIARTGSTGLALLQGGAAAATRPVAVTTALTGAAVATEGVARLRPLESRSYHADPLAELHVAVDQTGKAHKQLPTLDLLKSLSSDELRALKNELQSSVRQRIAGNIVHGHDLGHAARQAHEQTIIRVIEKILADRRQ